MSQNNIPDSLPSVERLLQRAAVAEKSQQKEIRISIEEARALTTELALITSKLGKTVGEIHQMLQDLKQSTTEVDVKMDGGSF